MTEKRYTYLNYSRDGHIGSFYLNDKPITNKEVWDILNEQEETIQELKTKVLDLRAEVGRLNCKKEIETPHWLKYKSSKGYTRQVNQDIRFKGDVE